MNLKTLKVSEFIQMLREHLEPVVVIDNPSETHMVWCIDGFKITSKFSVGSVYNIRPQMISSSWSRRSLTFQLSLSEITDEHSPVYHPLFSARTLSKYSVGDLIETVSKTTSFVLLKTYIAVRTPKEPTNWSDGRTFVKVVYEFLYPEGNRRILYVINEQVKNETKMSSLRAYINKRSIFQKASL